MGLSLSNNACVRKIYNKNDKTVVKNFDLHSQEQIEDEPEYH